MIRRLVVVLCCLALILGVGPAAAKDFQVGFVYVSPIGDAGVIVTRMFSSGWADPRCPVLALALIFSVWLYQYTLESKVSWVLELKPVRVGLVVAMILYLAVFAPSSDQAFIYLQF